MNVHEALSVRKSVRAFLDKPLSEADIVSVLDSARKAPSGVNTQPWQVAAVYGKKKDELKQLLEHAFRSGTKPSMDYHYYPLKWREPYKTRRFKCGLQLYETLGYQTRGERAADGTVDCQLSCV